MVQKATILTIHPRRLLRTIIITRYAVTRSVGAASYPGCPPASDLSRQAPWALRRRRPSTEFVVRYVRLAAVLAPRSAEASDEAVDFPGQASAKVCAYWIGIYTSSRACLSRAGVRE